MTPGELVKKADLALGDLTADGGYLNPEQANTFIRTLIKQPTILSIIRTVEMRSHTRKLDKVKFGSRILRAAVQSVALTESERAKPDLGQVELVSKEVIAEVRLPYDVIEDNIERGGVGAERDGGGGSAAGGGFVATIQTLMAEAAARDLEELAIRGDATSTDNYLALTDGFLATLTADGHVVDNSGATASRDMFKRGLQALPSEFHRNRPQLRHMISTNNEIEYRETVANRGTTLGDTTVTNWNAVFAYGVPVQPVMLMPEDRGMMTYPMNLIFGIQRRMTLEYEKLISERVYKMVMTFRVDFQIEESDAGVIYTGIGQS